MCDRLAVATSPPCPQVPTHPRDYISCLSFFRFLWSGVLWGDVRASTSVFGHQWIWGRGGWYVLRGMCVTVVGCGAGAVAGVRVWSSAVLGAPTHVVSLQQMVSRATC